MDYKIKHLLTKYIYESISKIKNFHTNRSKHKKNKSQYIKHHKINSNDILASIALITLTYIIIKHIYIFFILKLLTISPIVNYFGVYNSSVFEGTGISIVLYVTSLFLYIIIAFPVLCIYKNKNSVGSLTKLVMLTMLLSFIIYILNSIETNGRITFHGPKATLATLFGLSFLVTLFFTKYISSKILQISVSYISIFILFSAINLYFVINSNHGPASDINSNSTIRVTYTNNKTQEAQILMTMPDWVLLEIDGDQVMIPEGRIDRINLGKRQISTPAKQKDNKNASRRTNNATSSNSTK